MMAHVQCWWLVGERPEASALDQGRFDSTVLKHAMEMP